MPFDSRVIEVVRFEADEGLLLSKLRIWGILPLFTTANVSLQAAICKCWPVLYYHVSATVCHCLP